MKVFYVVLSLIVSSVLLAGTQEESIILPKTESDVLWVKSLKETIADYNKKLNSHHSSFRYFAQLGKKKSDRENYLIRSDRVLEVKMTDSWPEQEVTEYLVLLQPDGSAAYLQENPVCDSGDWSIQYLYYSDKKGNTIAFQRYSSFFYGSPDSSALEISTYYFRDRRLIAKDYILVD